MWPRILYQALFQGNYMSQTFGTITTFLAVVTKFRIRDQIKDWNY